MKPPPVASNLGFSSRILFRSFRENLQVVRDNIQDGKFGFEGYPYSSRQVVKIGKLLETSGWRDSVSSFDVTTATEPLAAATKGGLLIPAISSSHKSQ